MTLDADDKDWTWVLDATCPQCEFDCTAHARDQIGAMIRVNARTWQRCLQRPGVSQRLRQDRWSTLEYGCHVRDVYRVYQTRVGRMLNEDGPRYDNWNQDESAELDRYNTQDPSTVASELVAVAGILAATFDTVSAPEQWERTGVRSDGSNFTVESISRYMMHDTIHHLVDIGFTPAEANPPYAS